MISCAHPLLAAAILVAAAPARGSLPPLSATIEVDASTVVQTTDRRMLVGSNIASWFDAGNYGNRDIRSWVRDLGPTLIRLPGGSWGDVIWWNGNGVRKPGSGDLDLSRHDSRPYSAWSAPFGVWNVDYSAYAPGFKSFKGANDGWHGHVDVKTMHEWVRAAGSRAIVIVNGGQGTPRDAAEWVRWSRSMGYAVGYWEIGNELGGSWEAGNMLPGGSRLDGRVYARRYEEFARAMKAVDPSIRIGTMDWVGDVLAHCGDLVDFVSIHAYPVNGSETDDELFAKLDAVRREVEPVRELIRRYQPARAGKIGIGYTEWNMHLPDTRGLIWNARWLGEMFRNGVNFATHFHIFDLLQPGPPARRHVAWWAFQLWRHAMGDDLLSAPVAGPGAVAAFATRVPGGLSIMAFNSDQDREASVRVSLGGFTPGTRGRMIRMGRREHMWLDNQPGVPDWRKSTDWAWSSGPDIRPFTAAAAFVLTLPPASLAVVQVPGEGRTLPPLALPAPKVVKAATPRLEIRLPPGTAYADTPLEGWVLAFNGARQEPYPRSLPDGALRVTGPGKADRETVRLAEGAGRFLLTASGPGPVTLEVAVNGRKARKTVDFLPSVPQPRVFWEFEDEAPGDIRSQWPVAADPGIRPNQRVIRVDPGGDNPSASGKRELLVIQSLPGADRLNKANIRGVFFDLRTSPDFRCDDPEAGITVVMQSPMNWWMVLGGVKLSEYRDWKTVTLPVEKPEHVRAMPAANNVWLLLEASKPVHGSVYVDRAGLMVR